MKMYVAEHAARAPGLSSDRLHTEGPLTRDEANTAYVIIRHNVRTYRSAGVAEVIKGKQKAEASLKNFEQCQSSSDRLEGWRYFLEETTLKAGTDPAVATSLRQTDLEMRESKAPQMGDSGAAH